MQACVPHYGVYDFAGTSGAPASARRLRALLARYVVGRDPVEFLDDYVAASPLDRITDQAPPFFVLHGDRDTMVPVAEAREFIRRLRAISPHPVAYAELAGAQHAFDLLPSIRGTHVVRAVARFLDWAHQHHKALTTTATLDTARSTLRTASSTSLAGQAEQPLRDE
ncbi:Prolyl oligopeptidase family protein [Amycolatopsis arida]|uniref:Prolyl oligopeptidase family protein n=1 Tax=Amycolatopsis arida TaxID=587909 RepID=A0A1I5VMN7_9PSEU|nr:prolyl oligopeptidase family protein [Amycolatopsis arida]SFQ08547.1 Prolyl oligopeptidase family protein [Amycolatopsis arida]